MKAEGLNGTHHDRDGIRPAAGRAVDRDHGARDRPPELAQEPALEPEVNAQALGNGEDELKSTGPTPCRRLFGETTG